MLLRRRGTMNRALRASTSALAGAVAGEARQRVGGQVIRREEQEVPPGPLLPRRRRRLPLVGRGGGGGGELLPRDAGEAGLRPQQERAEGPRDALELAKERGRERAGEGAGLGALSGRASVATGACGVGGGRREGSSSRLPRSGSTHARVQGLG